MSKISELPRLAEADVDGTELVPVTKGPGTLAAPIGTLGRKAAEEAREYAGFAEEFSGPAYDTRAAGEAATAVGRFFRVSNGDTPRTYTRYQRTAGGSVLAAPLASAAELAGPLGAALVGAKLPGTGTVPLTVLEMLLRSPATHGVAFDRSAGEEDRLAEFFANARPEFFRFGGRVLLGEWAGFNGLYAGYDDLTGLSALTMGLNNWVPREATVGVDSYTGSMALVGHSQSSKAVNWFAHPYYVPPTIGATGSIVNDDENGQGWGGYFEFHRMATCFGFSTCIELAGANWGDVSDTDPFQLTNGSQRGGTLMWGQPGAGASLVRPDLARIGLEPEDVNHITAIAAFTGMQLLALGYDAWANDTNYAYGAIHEDPVSHTVFRCMVPHVSPATGTFAEDRAANPDRWKQNPGALRGFVFGVGSLAERSPGSNFYEAFAFPEHTAMSWYRKTATDTTELSARIYCEHLPDGRAAEQLVFRDGYIWTNVNWGGSADGTYGAQIQGRGAGGGHSFSFELTPTHVNTYVNGFLVAQQPRIS